MQTVEWVRNLIEGEIATVSRLRSSPYIDFPHSIHLESLWSTPTELVHIL